MTGHQPFGSGDVEVGIYHHPGSIPGSKSKLTKLLSDSINDNEDKIFTPRLRDDRLGP